MRNILFYTSISPFPTNGGERIRSYGLLKALSLSDNHTIAVIENIDKVDLNAYSLPNVTYIEYNPSQYSAIEKITCSYYFKQNRRLLSIFDKIIEENHIDCVFLDFIWVGQYINYFKKRNINVILGTHNADGHIAKQGKTTSIIQYIRKKQKLIYTLIHERKYLKDADKIIVVSMVDFEYYKNIIDAQKIIVIPNFLDESLYLIEKDIAKENYIIMTANFGVFMNYYGLEWFLKKVWDKELSSLTKFLLVGKNSKEALKKLGNYNNVFAEGIVDDVKPFLSKAHVSIIPLLHGSGTRLKCLESMAMGLNIVSTQKGVEGIHSKEFLIADTPEYFKEKIKEALKINPFNEKVRQEFLKSYSLNSIKDKLLSLIDEVST